MGNTGLAGRRVLLVEDEFLIALEITDALTQAGADISGPHMTLDDAKRAAGDMVADLAILDIDLKGEEVFPVADILRRRGIPFLFCTGRPDRDTLRTEFPEVPVCVKPCRPSELIDALSRLLPMVA
ncbi:response regulator [Pelagibacterium limicola]|uniref:response regulator n=1 Tax=Pelagibacterium limicola TaxID=2791022 RepID=UPI0018AFE0E1|nr:response regulator [Pelagibacterium limicola]